MKGYKQLGFGVNDEVLRSSFVSKVQISRVKEVFVSKTTYSCCEAIAQCD